MRSLRLTPSVLLTLLASGLLMSCESAPTSSGPLTEAPSAEVSQSSAATRDTASKPAAQVPRSRPQLVKKVELVLVVNAIKNSLPAVGAIAQQQQGDILQLQDQTPSDSTRHTASIQIRVPQDRLQTTLDALAKLGTVQRQSLTAEDVSNQLVDHQARLRNLRKSEAAVLQLMERSGSISDVLKVSQELSTIRDSIEQIDAQLSSLRNQVTYSTISLSLEETLSATPPQRSLGSQVQESWEQSSHSVGALTVGLLKLGIWLVAYSPYLLLLAAAGYGFTRLKQRRSRPLTQEPEPPIIS